jgi:hypothetical protein
LFLFGRIAILFVGIDIFGARILLLTDHRPILLLRLKVGENTVLGRIFGPKRDEVTGGRRKLHNEELHNMYLYNYDYYVEED